MLCVNTLKSLFLSRRIFFKLVLRLKTCPTMSPILLYKYMHAHEYFTCGKTLSVPLCTFLQNNADWWSKPTSWHRRNTIEKEVEINSNLLTKYRCRLVEMRINLLGVKNASAKASCSRAIQMLKQLNFFIVLHILARKLNTTCVSVCVCYDFAYLFIVRRTSNCSTNNFNKTEVAMAKNCCKNNNHTTHQEKRKNTVSNAQRFLQQ